MLPKGGEMTDQETSRVLTTNKTSYAGVPDMENWVHFARTAEECGIESLLLSFGNYEPDTLHIACALGRETTSLKYIAAYRLGLMQPTLFVQQLNTLSHLVDGRVSVNVIAGSSPAEQRGYGDYLNHDERYDRAEEFLAICHHFWRDSKTAFDYTGRYHSVEGARIHTPFCDHFRSTPEIYVSGHSEGAKSLALNAGTCWLRVIDSPEALAPHIEIASAGGIEVGLRLNVVCRETKAEAIRAAQSLQADDATIEQVRRFLLKSDSKVFKDSLSNADDYGWLTDYLWAGLVPSYGPSAITIVGTPEEVASAFFEYKAVGIHQFIISGWPKIDEMKIFGSEVLPIVRAKENAV